MVNVVPTVYALQTTAMTNTHSWRIGNKINVDQPWIPCQVLLTGQYKYSVKLQIYTYSQISKVRSGSNYSSTHQCNISAYRTHQLTVTYYDINTAHMLAQQYTETPHPQSNGLPLATSHCQQALTLHHVPHFTWEIPQGEAAPQHL